MTQKVMSDEEKREQIRKGREQIKKETIGELLCGLPIAMVCSTIGAILAPTVGVRFELQPLPTEFTLFFLFFDVCLFHFCLTMIGLAWVKVLMFITRHPRTAITLLPIVAITSTSTYFLFLNWPQFPDLGTKVVYLTIYALITGLIAVIASRAYVSLSSK